MFFFNFSNDLGLILRLIHEFLSKRGNQPFILLLRKGIVYTSAFLQSLNIQFLVAYIHNFAAEKIFFRHLLKCKKLCRRLTILHRNKTHVTLNIFAHNIEIKRHFDKKIIFSSKYCSDILKYFQTRFQ